MHSHLEHFESLHWRNVCANTNIAIISNPDSKLPALEHQVRVSRSATRRVIIPVNTALFSCNANVQQDTEMSLKTIWLYQSSSVHLQNISPLSVSPTFTWFVLTLKMLAECIMIKIDRKILKKNIMKRDLVVLKSMNSSNKKIQFQSYLLIFFSSLKQLQCSHKL